MWYWIGCIEFATTYVYTATEVTGPWTLTTTLDTCFYDCGLFFDDDDTPYVAYGNTELYVAQLSGSTLSTIVKTELVYTAPSSVGALEGSRMYKRNSIYYICTDHPASQEWVLQAPSPFGTYTAQLLADGLTTPISGGGYSHQGGLVQTQNDEWYYMAFQVSIDQFLFSFPVCVGVVRERASAAGGSYRILKRPLHPIPG